MTRTLYSLLLRLALPAQALRYRWRGWRNPEYRGSLRGHLALGLPVRSDHPLWLHAASVGEVQALSPLVQRLREDFPALPLLITVGTPTGLARARERFAQFSGDAAALHAGSLGPVSVLAAPWDLPGAARRFIASQRPRAAIFIETELWPNLLLQVSRAGIPALLVSARVSERSASRYRRWVAGLMRDTVRSFARIGAQTPADRDRFIGLGAEPGAVECWGNLKFDFSPPSGTAAQGQALRARIAADRPMWVAGSTHAPEEEACLAAHRSLQDEARKAGLAPSLLVIAPRRPERFEEVARLIAAQGFVLGRHSRPGQLPDVLLVDRLGELLPYYAAADVAFVGGSLAPVGGHNLLEPAAFGRPVLAGPHTGNAPDVAIALEKADALGRVENARALEAALRELLGDPALARRKGEAAQAVVAANAGATTRVLAALIAVLPAQPAAWTDAPKAP
jgi:3-deoxy-D-manno-octulosonic-acid transferase